MANSFPLGSPPDYDPRYFPGLADACRRAYHATIDAVRDAAREKGYAIGVHGSLARDIDLIAVPWADDAAPAEELVEAVRAAAEMTAPGGIAHIPPKSPGQKPHGRLAWTIVLGRGPFIDLSVMPLTPARRQDIRQEPDHG